MASPLSITALRDSLLGVLTGLLTGVIVLLAIVVWQADRLTLFNPNGWMTARDLGSTETDPLTKAFIARIGLFANSAEEALYLQAIDGEPLGIAGLLRGRPARRLQGGVRYRIVGAGDIPSAWYSLTLYDADEYLYPNAESRWAFRDEELIRGVDGSWAVDVAPERPADARNWLPAPHEGEFSVTLRIYQPDPLVYADLTSYDLPRVFRVEGP